MCYISFSIQNKGNEMKHKKVKREKKLIIDSIRKETPKPSFRFPDKSKYDRKEKHSRKWS